MENDISSYINRENISDLIHESNISRDAKVFANMCISNYTDTSSIYIDKTLEKIVPELFIFCSTNERIVAMTVLLQHFPDKCFQIETFELIITWLLENRKCKSFCLIVSFVFKCSRTKFVSIDTNHMSDNLFFVQKSLKQILVSEKCIFFLLSCNNLMLMQLLSSYEFYKRTFLYIILELNDVVNHDDETMSTFKYVLSSEFFCIDSIKHWILESFISYAFAKVLLYCRGISLNSELINHCIICATMYIKLNSNINITSIYTLQEQFLNHENFNACANNNKLVNYVLEHGHQRLLSLILCKSTDNLTEKIIIDILRYAYKVDNKRLVKIIHLLYRKNIPKRQLLIETCKSNDVSYLTDMLNLCVISSSDIIAALDTCVGAGHDQCTKIILNHSRFSLEHKIAILRKFSEQDLGIFNVLVDMIENKTEIVEFLVYRQNLYKFLYYFLLHSEYNLYWDYTLDIVTKVELLSCRAGKPSIYGTKVIELYSKQFNTNIDSKLQQKITTILHKN